MNIKVRLNVGTVNPSPRKKQMGDKQFISTRTSSWCVLPTYPGSTSGFKLPCV